MLSASFWRGFLSCLLPDHQLLAVPELQDPICGWSPADLLRAVLNPWIPSPLGASELGSWRCRSLEIVPLVGAVVLGSWSLRISSLFGAPMLCLWLSLGILALRAPPACPGLVPEELDKLGLNVLLGEAGLCTVGFSWPLPFCGAGSAGAGAAGNPQSTAQGPPVPPPCRMRGQVWGVPHSVPVSSGFSASSPCRSPRAGSESRLRCRRGSAAPAELS